MTWRCGFAALMILLWIDRGCAQAGPACAPKSFDGAKFTVCAFDPRHDDIRLFLGGADAKPYGSLAALAAALKAKGQSLAFAMNAGMFKEDLSPVGLYVENRRKLHEADTRGGATNFHLKPNGVFWIGDGGRGGRGDQPLSRRPAGGALRDPIGPDAGRRRQDPSEDQAERRPRRRSATASAPATAARSCSPSPTSR